MKRSNLPGLFLTFEGGEGVGKTTLINHLFNYLKQIGKRVIKTRAPGGTILGNAIRHILLHTKNAYPTKRAELLLFLADRAQHVDEVILPALEEGTIVLCDRFHDSTYAYQGAARNFEQGILEQLCVFAGKGIIPDHTFFIDLDPRVGLDRIKKRRQEPHDRMEEELLSFHRKVRDGYLSLADKNSERFFVIDGHQSENVVFESARQMIEKALCLS